MAPGKQPDRRRIEEAATAADARGRKAGLRAGADGGNRTHTSGLETVARPSSCIRRMNASIPANAGDRFVRWLSKSFKLTLIFPQQQPAASVVIILILILVVLRLRGGMGLNALIVPQ